MILPNATPEDFAAPGKASKFITYLDGQSAQAQSMWNGLFVTALKEVRRRANIMANIAGSKIPQAANIASKLTVPLHPVEGMRP